MTPLPGSPSAPNTAREVPRTSPLGCMASIWLSTLPVSAGAACLGLMLYLLPRIVAGLEEHSLEIPPTAAWLLEQRTPASLATITCMIGAIVGLLLGRTRTQRILYFSLPTILIMVIAATVILGLGQAYVELLGSASSL